MNSLASIVSDAYLSALAGNLSGASASIRAVRSQFAIENNSSLTAEIMIVEGMIHIYSGRSGSGVERLTRAVAISDSAGHENLASLARGWLAVVHYNEGNVIAAGKALLEALRCAESADARTCLRVSTIAGVLCEYSSLGRAASAWLMAAQVAARRMAIPGVLSSVVYDLALAAIDSASARKLTGKLDREDARRLPLRVMSALNYDANANVGVHRDLHWLVLAMAYNLCEDYLQAELSLDRYFGGASSFRAADDVCARVEYAIARSKGGELEVEANLIEEIRVGLDLLVEPIERAMALDVLARHCCRLSKNEEAKAMRAAVFEEIDKRNELANSLEKLVRESLLFTPPLAWTN
jgi:hypothetical protein